MREGVIVGVPVGRWCKEGKPDQVGDQGTATPRVLADQRLGLRMSTKSPQSCVCLRVCVCPCVCGELNNTEMEKPAGK